MRIRSLLATAFITVQAVVAALPTPASGQVAAPAGGFATYTHASSKQLDVEQDRRAIASRYGMVIVKGALRSDVLTDMRAVRPDLKILAYEQAAALNQSETAEAAALDPTWLAVDATGARVAPRNLPGFSLGDLTHPGFRAWRAERISREVEGGLDGSYLDTVGAFFSDGFYTARPVVDGVPVTDAAWRDGSADLLRRVRETTGRTVIANGFGLGTGKAYFDRQADADVLIAQADGVQIEGFTRWANTKVNSYYRDSRWQQDIRFLQLLGNRGKLALAYTKVGVAATTSQLTTLRDYALGSFLLGFVPGQSYFGFSDRSAVPSVPSDTAWALDLGSPLGTYTKSGAELARPFAHGVLHMTRAQAPRITAS